MRTLKGAARRKAKRRLFKRAKGFRGGRSNLLRTVRKNCFAPEHLHIGIGGFENVTFASCGSSELMQPAESGVCVTANSYVA